MTNQKSLVFVVGAGGSKEVNLPIGAELKNSIALALNFKFEHGHQVSSGDLSIVEALRVHVQNNSVDGSRDINPYCPLGVFSKIYSSVIEFDK